VEHKYSYIKIINGLRNNENYKTTINRAKTKRDENGIEINYNKVLMKKNIYLQLQLKINSLKFLLQKVLIIEFGRVLLGHLIPR
jgi:hypothetical protein